MTVLTIAEVMALAKIIEAASREARVGWETLGGEVVQGTARHVVTSAEWPVFPGSDVDVRDCALRVTTLGGTDVFLPVRDLVAQVQDGTFVVSAN